MINFDQLVIDRVLDGWFESQSDNSVLAVLDQIQNFQIAVTSTTKDKTDAQGALIKRFYTAKQAEITGEPRRQSGARGRLGQGLPAVPRLAAAPGADVGELPRQAVRRHRLAPPADSLEHVFSAVFVNACYSVVQYYSTPRRGCQENL